MSSIAFHCISDAFKFRTNGKLFAFTFSSFGHSWVSLKCDSAVPQFGIVLSARPFRFHLTLGFSNSLHRNFLIKFLKWAALIPLSRKQYPENHPQAVIKYFPKSPGMCTRKRCEFNFQKIEVSPGWQLRFFDPRGTRDTEFQI